MANYKWEVYDAKSWVDVPGPACFARSVTEMRLLQVVQLCAALAAHPVLSAAAAKIDDYSGVGVVKHISYDVLKTITLERTRARARTRARSGCHVLAVHVAVAAVAPT